ncbi:AzlC family ABC transporter permease [Pseudonocardia sp. MH-G8]|uniref:AzlC family ABC transporter permease n=1 Tax=Pseudonocardia sp. MH-G8 TaxID=1854588 RepID=UPI000BA0CE47|nr:AzlC family ABC transporter permease [Pseudonocardia sp. MH-G8]OZM84246.1 branched-chain amino acid ABC transporter permease [Pseudonocardia sp. MH-G8]
MHEPRHDEPPEEARPPWRRAAVSAARDVLGVGPGMVLLGVSFGLLVVSSGLPWWWAPVISGVVYAGSLEFLLIALVGAGTPLAAIALTTVLVNGRHVFYGLSFPLHHVRSHAGRAYAIFALIDEAYALVATRPGAMSGARILWTQVLLHSCWVGGGVLGAAAGAGLAWHAPALEFVFTALFVVLALDAARAEGEVTGPALAMTVAVPAGLVVPGQMLLAAMALFVVLLLVRRQLPRRRRGADA